MAKKVFRDKGDGHFSEGKTPKKANDPALETDFEEEQLRHLEEQILAGDFLEIEQELNGEIPIDLSDPLEYPLEGLDLPEEMMRPSAQSGGSAQSQNPEKKAGTGTKNDRVKGNGTGNDGRKKSPAKAQKPEPEGKKVKQKKVKQKKPALRKVAVLLSLLLFIEAAYCVVIFTDWIKPLAALRTIYIDTAMSTMTHQWLATALIPGDVVQKVVAKTQANREAQLGVDSKWEDADKTPQETKSPSSGFSKDAAASMLSQLAQDAGITNDDVEFFKLFYELDEKSTRAYAEAHPEVIANGWSKFWVHEAGLDDEGTDIYTKQGDQVLAIDAENGLMVVRITGSTYSGALVIGKDASRLKCAPSSQWGAAGEWVGDIAQNNNGLVAMTGSGFEDSPNVSEGADQSGAAMCSGEKYYDYNTSDHYRGGKRIELRRDNRLYIVDSYTDFHEDCTDATEFTPALIIDGVNVAGEDYTYTAMNPRACIGQTKDESIMMLAIEGRKIDSIGCNVEECASIMERYGAYQAMNLDGGTSASLWYEGEYIIRCSNGNLIPEGRRLPNAWVYSAEPVANP